MIKFFTGTMRSGKSYELIQEIKKATGKALIIKPSLDTRDGDHVRSRATADTYPANLIDDTDLHDIWWVLSSLKGVDYLFIDEVQFFSKEFIEALIWHCKSLNIQVVASGLIKDFRDVKFPASEYLQLEADYVRFMHGDCDNCGKPSSDHNIRVDANGRMVTEGESIGIEGEFKYLTVCRQCKKHFERPQFDQFPL
ncbi:thymidine kinase [Paenibacillus sp. Soil724D2]|uniref:thymidine kinase n=1 Tax=Paenibacillus sp. (strain Soil724D2) TaxID=1736392 RepID=UPI0007128AB7|nr:hypothetical protein [Paenibacillus sp. Soil724D2]KRE33460.1 hypothetical protein ASG85_14430 [Paenibacillus sp. Soil724D2]